MARLADSPLRRSAALALAISLLVAAITFSSNLIVARFLPVSEFALFAASMTFLNLLGVTFSGFQISTSAAVTRLSHPSLPGRDKFSSSLLKGSIVLALSFWAFSFFWNGPIGLDNFLILILALAIPGAALSALVNGQLAGLGRFATQTLISLAILSANLAFQITAALTFGLSVDYLIFQLVAINTLAMLFASKRLKSMRGNEDSAFSRENLTTVASAGLFWFLANFDLLLCALFLSEPERNQYAVAASFSRMFLFLFATVSAAIFTKLNRNLKAGLSSRNLFLTSGVLILGAIIVISIALFVWGDAVLITFYGEKYAVAGAQVRYMGFATIPFVLAQLVMQLAHLKPSASLATILLIASFAIVLLSHLMISTAIELAVTYSLAGCGVLASIGIFVLRQRRFNAQT